MKGSCPLKTAPDWLALENTIGENNTWKVWMSSREDVLPEPVAGAFFLFTEAEPIKAAALLNKYVPLVKRQKYDYSTTLLDMINDAQEGMFNEDVYKQWLANNDYLDKLFQGEIIKRTEEEKEIAAKRFQTLEELANEVPEEFVEPITAIDLQNKMRKDEFLYKFGENLGRDFIIVTTQEANNILTKTATPYQGQSVFIINNKIHLVEDKISLNSNFADIALPLIHTLRLNAKDTFNAIYERFLKTPQAADIQEIINDKYPTIINKDSDLYKELVLAESLKYYASVKNAGTNVNAGLMSEAFDAFIKNNLMYHIKQRIRKQFGTVKVEKLTPNDSVSSFVKMVENENFKLENEEVNAETINSYNNELEKAAKEITDAIKTAEAESKLMGVIDNFIMFNDRQLRLTKAKPYWDIKKVIADEEAGGYLRDIAERLKDVDPSKVKNYADLTLSFRTKALINSLFTLDKTLTEINKYLETIAASNAKPVDKLKDVAYAHDLLKQWGDFIDQTERAMIEAGIPKDSYVFRFVATLDASVKKGKETFVTIQEDGAVKSTTDLLNYFSENITKNIDEEIKRLEEMPADSYRDKLIKELKEKKKKYTFDEDKIKKLYTGELGDSNFWSTMFESYTTNPDPILSTFALFLKKHTSDITANAFLRSRKFSETIQPLMESLGITGNDPRKEFGEYIITDTKAGRDENGRLTKQAVLSLMAPTTSGRYEVAMLEQDIEDAKKANDPEKLKEAYKKKEEFLNKYFNREYVKSYYEDRKVLENENYDAFMKLEEINLEIKKFRADNPNELDTFENNSILDNLLKQRERLYSIFDENGNLKDQKDQKIARDLTAHRKRMGKYYDAIPKKGQFQREFEAFSNLLATDPRYSNIAKYNPDGTLTDEFKDLQYKWLKQNSRVKYTQAYYDRQAELYDTLAELSKDLPDEYKVDALYKERTAILSGYKDSYGQTDPSKMANRAKILEKLKNIQEKINDIQFKSQNDQINLSTATKLRIKEVLKELAELQFKEPTEYYMDELNQNLIAINAKPRKLDEADSLLSDIKLLEGTLLKKPSFAKWFNENHVKRYYMTSDGTKKYKYERLNAWSVVIPIEKNPDVPYIEKTKVKFEGQTYEINGIPSSRFFFFKIKDEFKTIKPNMTKEEKAQFVNNRGEYLPLSKEQGAPQDSPFINHAYYEIIKDSKKAALLKAFTEYHVDNQIGLDKSQKLYLDIPRFPIKDNLERLRTGRPLKRWVDRIKSVGRGMAATLSGKSKEEANIESREEIDVEDELGNVQFEEDYEKLAMAKNALLDPVVDKIPMRGLSNIPIEEVSYDLITSFNLYMLQAEKQRVFNEISPVAQAMMNTLENLDEAARELDKIRNKQGTMRDSVKALFGNKGTSNRVAGFKALYNREFKGKVFDEKHLDWINKVTAGITKGASINYFALNLPSAVKNYWGILWQLNVEATAGEYFDFVSMGKGKIRSKTAMNEWTTRIWGGNYNTLDTQLIMLMDPLQGKADESLGKDASRTFAKDLASLSFVYSPRKFMEMEGGLQLFYSMMYHKQIPRIVNGVETSIAYADAFELDKSGKMVLKEGVDATYGITYEVDENGQEKAVLGKEFVKMQNAVHEKFKDLNGAFAKFEQPQAQAFFAYRLFAFMRRYFTSMFMNRFGKDRANFALGTIRAGYYVEATIAIAKTIATLGKHIKYLQKSEKRAMARMLMDAAQILIVSMVASLLFGYDDDDEDRFEKLRAKSGALGEDDFELTGWLSNHALTLMLKTQAENQSFIPLPGVGLNNYLDLTSSTSLAFGPTITSYSKILTDIALHAMPGENEDLFYKKDTGPYEWQKEGEAKIWNHLGTMLGFSGSQVDPVKGLQSFETFSRQ